MTYGAFPQLTTFGEVDLGTGNGLGTTAEPDLYLYLHLSVIFQIVSVSRLCLWRAPQVVT